MLTILVILGTRPEAIKMAPVIKELERQADGTDGAQGVASRVCVTAQHRHLLDQVLDLFGIVPDYDLNLMRDAQSPTQVAAAVLSKLHPIIKAERPDWVLLQGDTTTAMAASITAFYAGVKVGHIEAGLRTYDNMQPFPEEVNRRIAGLVADLHFVPTEKARANLLRENIDAEKVVLTGNPVIDALHTVSGWPYHWNSGPLAHIPWQKRILFITAHRRENFGRPLESICAALREIAQRYRSSVHIVYPVHLNPEVQATVQRGLSHTPGITLVPPLDYLSLVHLLRRSYLVLTDSGGLQEEAPSLGKPVLILRDRTERLEAVEAGTVKLVGTVRQTIVKETARLLDDAGAYRQMAQAINPYGDGQAAKRIVKALIARASDGMPAPAGGENDRTGRNGAAGSER